MRGLYRHKLVKFIHKENSWWLEGQDMRDVTLLVLILPELRVSFNLVAIFFQNSFIEVTFLETQIFSLLPFY